MLRRYLSVLLAVAVGWLPSPVSAQATRAGDVPLKEAYLQAADQFVLKSDKYLHHSKLVRGQKGFGRTVLCGTQIVEFQAEILSVMRNWNPHQDVILARLSGQNLEATGVIAGMSGSPVYIKTADGKERMVGAVAYGWRGQKEAVCGLQPIAQMLAVTQMQGKIGALPAGPARPGPTSSGGLGRAEFLKTFLAPGKNDFSTACWPARPADRAAVESAVGLAPLATPLMVRGLNAATLRRLSADLEPAGLVPVQAGGLAAADKQAALLGPKFAPGSAIAISLVSGDADMSGVGTVTEVVGDHVLAFGHAMFGEGEVSLPMGPAFVHGVVASIMGSFKLGATIELAGTLSCDEKVGICGLSTQKPRMVPFDVRIDWKQMGGKRTFHFELAQHRMLTPVLTRSVANDSATTWQEVPELHTIQYDLAIDCGPVGAFRSRNVSSMADLRNPLSDLGRVVAGMLNNPFGPPPDIRRIELDMTIERGSKFARIVDLRLDAPAYRPGQTVTGTLVVQPFRGDRTTLPVRLELPADLSDGPYSLAACSNVQSMAALQREKPHRFDPRTVKELFDALQEVVQGDASNLYLRLPLKRTGLALDKRELGDLPERWSAVLAEAGRVDANAFAESLVRTQPTPYVLDGAAAAEFQVRREVRETILREK